MVSLDLFAVRQSFAAAMDAMAKAIWSINYDNDVASLTPLATSTRDHPIIAYKRAAITEKPLRLYGVGMHAAYLPEDTAKCLKHLTHMAPEQGCSCGFYAMDKKMLGHLGAEYNQGCADLEVELYGRVIRHRDGYRAQHQRVLGVHLDPACHICGRQATHLAPYRFGVIGITSAGTLSTRPEPPRLVPYCATHLVPTSAAVTPSDVANAWGIEVRFGSIA